MFTVCLPSFTLNYLPPVSSCSLSFSPSPPQSPLPPSFLFRWCDPHITHHELLRWNPALLCCPNKSQTFQSSYVSSLLTLSALCLLMYLFFRFNLWLQIRSQVSVGNVRFLVFFFLILRNLSHCEPSGTCLSVTAGGWVNGDGLTAHTHSEITVPHWNRAQLA